MIANFGFYSYGVAAVGFGVFAIILLGNWRKSAEGRLLALTVVATSVWAVLAAFVALHPENVERWSYQSFEILRYVGWYAFLLRLYRTAASGDAVRLNYLRRISFLSIAFTGVLLSFELYLGTDAQLMGQAAPITLVIIGHLLLPMIGLTFVEQLFRNTAVQYRWATKYLFMGAGGIFAFDFFLYADALLFRHVDKELWDVRGFINLIAVPMLIIAARRNRDWSLNIFISRQVVFNTTAMLGGGLYLLVMAAAGYYINEFGGTWGRAAEILFIVLAFVLLSLVMFSSQLRAQLRVFLGKHFYSNKYDYRVEWLKLTRTLSAQGRGDGNYENAIRVLAEIVDARAGSLWLRHDGGSYENVGVWNMDWIEPTEPGDASLAQFLAQKSYIVNLADLEAGDYAYEGLELPAWLSQHERPWLIVPLAAGEQLLGFIVLARPLLVRAINWEDRDLLKTAAFQVESYLAGIMTSEALANSRQFEVFNRLSAYMVHDLKNIAAELNLITRNADRHRDNPDFLNDTFETVANASANIQRLLEQLRNKQALAKTRSLVALDELLGQVVAQRGAHVPVPSLRKLCDNCQVIAERDRLKNVLAHIIENAQQASDAQGTVAVSLDRRDGWCEVQVQDNGQGMDEAFIKNRLFKPFDTTKGNAGMGIGMYETRQFVQEAGGEILVSSHKGSGTRITVRFPCAPKE